jgi:predicted homoserine dehydrogenase-like protein
MMGVDKLLAERAAQGDPVRVAMAGCGFWAAAWSTRSSTASPV